MVRALRPHVHINSRLLLLRAQVEPWEPCANSELTEKFILNVHES